MKPWLDDLSEEWIPQSAPPAAAPQDPNSPSAPRPPASPASQSVPPKPRSRLPRLRQQSGSFSDAQPRHAAPKPRSALSERPLSDFNSPPPAAAHAPDAAHRLSASQSSVASSQGGSVVHHDTVAQNPAVPSAEKEQADNNNTPEWRRRLLKGEVGYGEQKDLFSPMGLENIFQKPSGGASEEPRQTKSRLGLFKSLTVMPSSPPPWPSAEQHKSEWHARDHAPSAPKSPRPDPETEQVEQSALDSSLLQVPQAGSSETALRTVSGQIEFENENFSPVYLSTNLRVRGPAKQKSNLDASSLAHRLRHLESDLPSFDDHAASEDVSLSQNQSRNDSSFSKLQDDTLPEDLPAGTPDIAEALTPFVEMKRGGYALDDSFIRRPLSPSPQPKTGAQNESVEENAPKKSTQVGSQSGITIDTVNIRRNVETPSLSPFTPRRPKQPQYLSPERVQTSGSPLKLFDHHDTFTSNRLQRRLSQLESKPDKVVLTTNQEESTKLVQKTSRLTSLEEVSIHKVTTQSVNVPVAPGPSIEPRRVGTFGLGDLDHHPFPEEFSVLSSQGSEEQYSFPDESPSMDIAPPGSRHPIRFQFDGSPDQSSRAKRQGLTRVSNPFRRVTQSIPQIRKEPVLNTPVVSISRQEYAEGKRGPTSPFKDPTPKRRRTLHLVDSEDYSVFSESELNPVKHSHAAMQSAVDQKPEEALQDHSRIVTDPETNTQRKISRPRNPTPNQRMRDEIYAEILEATDAFIHASPKLNKIREHLSSPGGPAVKSEKAAALVANEVAAFNMKRVQAVRSETRKRSVTTQDFLDEAVKIMDYIRAKGRPTSGLGSLEESESETPIPHDDTPVPSSPLSFSRPPSREGRLSEWKEPNKHDLDPHVESHLRQFQEESDEFMGSSIRSLRFSRVHAADSQESNNIVVEQNNIRITDNPNRNNRDHDDENHSGNPQLMINGTHASVASSLGQTVATNTSRRSGRSEHVATLAPEAVAHLIPEQIAGMNFDRAKNIWVRNKTPKEHRPSGETSNLGSEEDPFGNIPDLSVDETAEHMLKATAPSTRPQPTAETFLEETESGKFEQPHQSRPVTRDGKTAPPTDTSSARSKFSPNFGWSLPKTETRATSWSDQETRNGGTQKTQQRSTTYPIPESDEVDVEHEIKYFEGRDAATPPIANAKIRDITFSIGQRGLGTHSKQQQDEHSRQRNTNQQWAYSNPRQQPRASGTGAKTLPPPREQAIPEDGDLSVLDDLPRRNYRMQLSMSVSAPVLGLQKQDAMLAFPSSPVKGDATFMLSDLPDFTLHQVDECELPDRVVVKHDGTKFSKALEDRYALGTEELIKALQDVAPDEPYWEDLRKVNLHGKGLANLHRLEAFCYRLEELDVSKNSICQLKGIPFSVRRLQVQNNMLTGLTSWASLTNLQHLDISGNDIDSLDGLCDLIHLRTLKVDNNHVKSLDGILLLDGLMELSASGNQIEIVDFANANLTSLTDLKLRGNRLREVRDLHCLPKLQNLDLDDNCIAEFPTCDMFNVRCNSLRSLRLCRNGMRILDVESYCPRLESLYVDGNSLAHVPGLEHLKHLRTFSAREQLLASGSDTETCVANLFRNPDVRNLHISINPTRFLNISHHLLNLQRLELASMGLQELPDNFGQLTPNIRTINLNFNSIQDLRPLLNIKRISELLVAGNKLDRLRTNMAVLGKLTTLEKLDMRQNPLTLRFYAPHSENRVMSLRQENFEDNTADRFVLPAGDADADKQYLQRLDFETRLRRRVQEIMLSTQCQNLRHLDGMPFDKSSILVKDDIWDRLSILGVIRRTTTTDESTG